MRLNSPLSSQRAKSALELRPLCEQHGPACPHLAFQGSIRFWVIYSYLRKPHASVCDGAAQVQRTQQRLRLRSDQSGKQLGFGRSWNYLQLSCFIADVLSG